MRENRENNAECDVAVDRAENMQRALLDDGTTGELLVRFERKTSKISLYRRAGEWGGARIVLRLPSTSHVIDVRRREFARLAEEFAKLAADESPDALDNSSVTASLVSNRDGDPTCVSLVQTRERGIGARINLPIEQLDECIGVLSELRDSLVEWHSDAPEAPTPDSEANDGGAR